MIRANWQDRQKTTTTTTTQGSKGSLKVKYKQKCHMVTGKYMGFEEANKWYMERSF